MKLSISLSDPIAREIKKAALQSERPVSWWIQKAWETARNQLLQGGDLNKAQKRALKNLSSLKGALKKSHPHISSVDLAHQAFTAKK